VEKRLNQSISRMTLFGFAVVAVLLVLGVYKLNKAEAATLNTTYPIAASEVIG